MLQYQLTPLPLQHQWQIDLSFYMDELTHNQIKELTLTLPNWVPGSYLIRDFSRHILNITATCNDSPVSIESIDKNHWKLPNQSGKWCISYTVYAFDLSVRGSYLDQHRGFFDGAALLISIIGFEDKLHQLKFAELPLDWQVATNMPSENGIYYSHSYAEFIDYPFELGKIEWLEFEAKGISHQIALSGYYEDFDRNRLIKDIQKICSTQLRFFNSTPPFKQYVFLLHLGDNIYGGLEHRNSTALLADRYDLPSPNMDEANKSYTQLLGLFSHEYFHAWNVKSIKPTCFETYDLNKEVYTEQLWAFEGITSYYDDLILVKSRTITPQNYLNLLANNINRVMQAPGHTQQTLADSSLSAWHKFYKPNENSPNALVSYYQKGALAALCLDLTIRQRSQNQFSLDKVMQTLYQRWLDTHKGIDEQEWQKLCQEITGLDLKDFFQQALYTTETLPLIETLATVGVELRFTQENQEPWLGIRFQTTPQGVKLTHILSGSPAEEAGLSSGDTIIAINYLACNDFTKIWKRLPTNTSATLHYFHQGQLFETNIKLKPIPTTHAVLTVKDPILTAKWLGQSESLNHFSTQS